MPCQMGGAVLALMGSLFSLHSGSTSHTPQRGQAMGKADGICCLHTHSHSCALSAGMATGLHGSSKIVTSLGREIKLRLNLTFVGNKEARIMVLSTLLTASVQTEYDFYTLHLTARRRGKSVKPACTGKQLQGILFTTLGYPFLCLAVPGSVSLVC